METKPKIKNQINQWSKWSVIYLLILLINLFAIKIGDSSTVIYFLNFLNVIFFGYKSVVAVFEREFWADIYKNPTMKDDYFNLP